MQIAISSQLDYPVKRQPVRRRSLELYFNGVCLLRAAFSGQYRKIPFFMRHLWCAIAD
ncbi:MAG TPA: hypothetical protein VGA56_18855 [Opitutaceae bacterium]